MKKIYVSWKQLVASLLVITMFATSVSLEAFATENTSVQTQEEDTDVVSETQEKEGEYQIDKSDIIQSELTADSTTYQAGNGMKVTEFYSQDVRFENEDGELTDYDPALVKIQGKESRHGISLEKYAYENKAGDKKQYFPEKLSQDTPILMEYENYQIKLAPVESTAEDSVDESSEPAVISGQAEVNSESEPEDIEKHKITYTYDVEDKVTGIGYALVENGGVEKLHFIYNDNRWLTAVKATVKGDETVKTVREYTYDDQGKVSEIREYPDFAEDGTTCITKTYTYNVLDQVTSMAYKQGSDILKSYSYQYDKNGNIIQKTEVNNTPNEETDQVNETRQYTYDTLGRLVKTVVTDHLENDTQQTITYEYDKAGNRTKKTKGSTEIVYTYNGLDQLLTAVTNRGGVETGTTTYTYDANGNQVKEVNTDTLTTTVNVYDAENRLSKVTRTTQASDSTEETFVQENLYNGEGQRIQKKEGAKVTNYFYQDGVVSYTTDANEAEKVFQNLLGLEGNIILAEKKLEASDENSDSHNYYLYNKDIQGSTVSILDETGAGELSYTYDDFGETEIHGNSSFENENCYTGGIYDESTELYYLNARYYDLATGRFLTEDTYRGELEGPDTLHLYAYCKNNPVNYVDPSGHYVLSVGVEVSYAFYLGFYKTFAIAIDGKGKFKILLTTGAVVNNAGGNASVAVVGCLYLNYNSVNKITNGTSTSISAVKSIGKKVSISGGVDISGKNKSITISGSYGPSLSVKKAYIEG